MDTNRTGFRAELETLINRYSKENGSNTPDFILADYMVVGHIYNPDQARGSRAGSNA
ncbi:MAG TPA: hypothetical protein VLH56_18395 [Dissulfurispiraceae bacterium]|nr:hypothetical protein [Dissulfurispiraceae bacterium]